jgi:4-carboxymuconolactone decarboxylase
MNAAQRRAADELAAGPRGGVVGPFIAALRSPELTSRLQRLGEYLRYRNALGSRLTELAILVTARAWTQQYEWAMHLGSAREAGLRPAAIRSIARGRRPAVLRKDERAVYDFCTELLREQAVSDRTYARAVAALGEPGVVDLLAAVGYYALLAMMLNVARTPLPPGMEPALERLPNRRPRRV